jgi:ATP-dependent Lon protease
MKEFGIAIGLAWTPVGGDILFIEATRMPGKGRLILTGSLGDVMKESAQTALSYLRSQAEKLKSKLTGWTSRTCIFTCRRCYAEGRTERGLAIVAALASLHTRKLIRSDTAMTGEISLRGRVCPWAELKKKSWRRLAHV